MGVRNDEEKFKFREGERNKEICGELRGEGQKESFLPVAFTDKTFH